MQKNIIVNYLFFMFVIVSALVLIYYGIIGKNYIDNIKNKEQQQQLSNIFTAIYSTVIVCFITFIVLTQNTKQQNYISSDLFYQLEQID